jgi:hypothetical protein
MHSQYKLLKSLIDQRHEEALREAQPDAWPSRRGPHDRPHFGYAEANPLWGSVLSLLHGTGLSG